MRAKGSGQSSLLLLDVIDILLKKKVPYAVIGAFAASFYGAVRASMDADAVISLAALDLDANELAAIFVKAGLRCAYSEGASDDPLDGLIKIHDKYDNQVDLITGIKGMDSEAFERLRSVSFLKHKIRLISIEDFIAMKIFAGSPKDLDDVRKALAVSRPKINIALLKKLTRQYGAREAKILKSFLK
jgi:predicted nucleotidyltransferase